MTELEKEFVTEVISTMNYIADGLEGKDCVLNGSVIRDSINSSLETFFDECIDRGINIVNRPTETVKENVQAGQVNVELLEETLSHLDGIREAISGLKEQHEEKEPKYELKESGEYIGNAVIGYSEDYIEDIITKSREHNLLFVGVPGCGKTHIVMELAKRIVGYEDSNRILQIDFTESTDDGQLLGGMQCIDGQWRFEYGQITKFCKLAEKYEDKEFVLILNELSRANTEAALGPAFTAMEKGYRGVNWFKLRNGESFNIPKNIIIMATMNATDKGVKKLDMAMSERFFTLKVEPLWEKIADNWKYDTFNQLCYEKNVAPECKALLLDLAKKVTDVNKRIAEEDGGEDYVIGHRQLLRYETINENAIKEAEQAIEVRKKSVYDILDIRDWE